MCFHGYQGLITLSPHLQGCIPVFLRDEHILPFSEELDWSRASLFLWRQELPGVDELLTDVGERVKESMRQQVLGSRGVVIQGLLYVCVCVCI